VCTIICITGDKYKRRSQNQVQSILIFVLQETKGEKCTTPSLVCIIICITGERKREAHTNKKSGYYFYYRRQKREKHTPSPVCIIISITRDIKIEVHTKSSLYYYSYYRRHKERSARLFQSVIICVFRKQEKRSTHQ
jgi:hypothetical protein